MLVSPTLIVVQKKTPETVSFDLQQWTIVRLGVQEQKKGYPSTDNLSFFPLSLFAPPSATIGLFLSLLSYSPFCPLFIVILHSKSDRKATAEVDHKNNKQWKLASLVSAVKIFYKPKKQKSLWQLINKESLVDSKAKSEQLSDHSGKAATSCVQCPTTSTTPKPLHRWHNARNSLS